MNDSMVGEVGVRAVGFEIEDRSAIGPPGDSIDRKEVQGSGQWDAQKMSGGQLSRGNEMRLVDTGNLRGEDGMLGCRLERFEQARRDSDQLPLVLMAKDPADPVRATVAASRRQSNPRLAPLAVGTWIGNCFLPQIVQASHSRIGSNADIAGK